MRRILVWLARFAVVVGSLAILAVLSIFIVHQMAVHRLKQIAERSPFAYVEEQSPILVLDHVRVIDGTGAPSREDQSIVIESGKITYVGPSSQRPEAKGSKVLNLAGHTVFPGLVGMHEHLFTTAPNLRSTQLLVQQSTLFPLMYLASGVTTIRTTGSIAPERDIETKHRIDQGTAVGPEMFLTAPYLDGQPSEYPEMHGLANDEEARRAVNQWADRGMTSFKAYTAITPEELRAAAQAAHSRGLQITGHLCTIGFKQAVDLGVDNLEHGLLVDTEFYSKKQPNACPPIGPYLSEYRDQLTVESQPVQDLIRYLVAHQIAVTSTLAVLEGEFGNSRPKADLDRAEHALTWKAWRLSRFRVAQIGRFHPAILLRKEMAFERDFAKAGGMLLAGSDPTGDGSVLAGFADQRQVELLVEADFTPVEAIKIATKNGADFLGIGDRVGTINPGKQADLVIVEGDPSLNISDIRKVKIVFRNRIGYNPAKLLEGIYGVVGLDN